MARFSRLFFAEGRRPVVWFDASDPNEILLRLLDFFWPALRVEFAACTYALKTREILSRPFNLIFAPSLAVSRYSHLENSHFVGYPRGNTPDVNDPRLRSLFHVVISALDPEQGAKLPDVGTEIGDLKHSLPADPSSLLKLVALADLRDRGVTNPASAVAALDVLAALAPAENSALEPKREALNWAMDRSMREPAAAAIELLSAISQRVIRAPYHRFRWMRARIVTLISDLVSVEPEAGVAVLVSAKSRRGALVAGVGAGLQARPERIAPLLGELEKKRPELVDALLGYEPELARIYLDAGPHSLSFQEVTEHVVLWLKRATSRRRKTITSHLTTAPALGRDARLIDAVLETVNEQGAQDVLATVLAFGLPADAGEGMWVHIESLSSRFPKIVRDHVAEAGLTSERLAAVWAVVLPATSEALEAISRVKATEPYFRACALAAFILRPDVRVELRNAFSTRSSHLVMALLAAVGLGRSTAISDALGLLLQNFETNDLADLVRPGADLWRRARALEHRSASLLVQKLLASASTSFFQGRLSSEAMREWLNQPPIQERLTLERPPELIGLWRNPSIRGPGHRAHETAELARKVWEWLELAAPIAARRNDEKLPALVGAAFQEFKEAWSSRLTERWIAVTEAARGRTHSDDVTALDPQAIQLAFQYPVLALSPLVRATFPRVYRATTSGRLTMIEMFYWYADWDKGKELRRTLVQAFVSSHWPPSDLAIIADEAGIVEKIVSRLERIGQGSYVEAMIADLEKGQGVANRQLAYRLRTRQRRIEEWD
ncbi:hypothetical protein [Microvirga tunisiensis]|uniref:Uncharacterized protein n=1 Tax=Microvirga tunisiensis TaxID=2108360 RepID=A0A5N7MVN5_9HYPH|nr:hypothetical protein [Microvirga tunisiensis]MPR13177.1 hypothetical protein [Microvirga tunisiensis]MPR31045.1 hypothetical protein [Microvirga tunisiensis]